MGGQLWALGLEIWMHTSIATLPRNFLSVRRALFSRKNGMKAGDLHVMKHVVNMR